MHIGNALCYLLAWLSARAQGGGVVLRFEDTDLLRMAPSAVEQTFSDLLWLGLGWDEGPAPEERGGTCSSASLPSAASTSGGSSAPRP